MSEIDDLLRTAQQQHSPEHALALAQIATAKAIQQQAKQIRIGNRLKVAALETMGPVDHTVLTPDEWLELGL